MLVDSVAGRPGRAVDRTLQARIGERLDLAAVAADEMMMMVTAWAKRLIPGDAVARIDAFHQPELRERVERAIHARDPDWTPGRAEPVVDLLGAQTAVLALEQADDRLPRAAAAIARPCQGAAHLRRPLHATTVSWRR